MKSAVENKYIVVMLIQISVHTYIAEMVDCIKRDEYVASWSE